MRITQADLDVLNQTFRQDGLDYEASAGKAPDEVLLERLEFGGCEDQEEALWAVLKDFAARHGAHLSGSSDTVRFID